MAHEAQLIVLTMMLASVNTGLAVELVDPTKPSGGAGLVAVAAQVDRNVDWLLTIIRVGVNSRHIVLNGALLHEGDEISGARVVAIAANEVTLESDQGSVVLRLSKPRVEAPGVSPGANDNPKQVMVSINLSQ